MRHIIFTPCKTKNGCNVHPSLRKEKNCNRADLSIDIKKRLQYTFSFSAKRKLQPGLLLFIKKFLGFASPPHDGFADILFYNGLFAHLRSYFITHKATCQAFFQHFLIFCTIFLKRDSDTTAKRALKWV